MNLTGHTLGKYKLREPLGRGGMAQVYKAFQPGIERFVAIKVLHGHLAGTGDFVTRFQREARNIGRLMHPNIVRLMDFDSEADLQYMVFDYIQHDTLDAYLRKNSQMPVEKALHVTAQLAKALAYAHQQGVIHRDIKPGNVMFTDEKYSHVVLTDFGLAYLLGETKMLTATGTMLGTPSYMSPEAIRGQRCSERSDIYSLGVVLFQMLTGIVPYEADTPYALMTKLANDPVPIPRQFNINIPPSVERLIMRAMAKDPNDRFQDATEFCQAVQQVQRLLRRNYQQVSQLSAPSHASRPSTQSGMAAAKKGVNYFVKRFEWPKLPTINRWVSLAASGFSILIITFITTVLLTGFGGFGPFNGTSSAVGTVQAATGQSAARQNSDRRNRSSSPSVTLERGIQGETLRDGEASEFGRVESREAPFSVEQVREEGGAERLERVEQARGVEPSEQINVVNQPGDVIIPIDESRQVTPSTSDPIAPSAVVNTSRANLSEDERNAVEIGVNRADNNRVQTNQDGTERVRSRDGNRGQQERRDGQRSARGRQNG